MHSLKPIGLVFLLGSGVITGVMLLHFEQKRCRQAEGFLALLRHIRLQIDCFSLPVSRILNSLPPQIREACDIPQDVRDFPSLLAQTRLLLPVEACELLSAFGEDLGSSYREDQLRLCDYYTSRLAPYCERIRAEQSRRMRLALILPIALAAALALLLI